MCFAQKAAAAVSSHAVASSGEVFWKGIPLRLWSVAASREQAMLIWTGWTDVTLYQAVSSVHSDTLCYGFYWSVRALCRKQGQACVC